MIYVLVFFRIHVGLYLFAPFTVRLLLIQYARQRAKQGARRGTDWASISDLPAPPSTCRRRVSVLKRDINFRKSLMRLCNLLTQRYAQQLDHENNLMTKECGQESDCQGQHWDDFDDSQIKLSLHEVLVQKQMMKLDSTKRSESASQVFFKLLTYMHKCPVCNLTRNDDTLRVA